MGGVSNICDSVSVSTILQVSSPLLLGYINPARDTLVRLLGCASVVEFAGTVECYFCLVALSAYMMRSLQVKRTVFRVCYC